MIFRHRSPWSHGIIFGTLIRILYCALMLALVMAAGICLRALFIAGGGVPGWDEIAQAWRAIESHTAARGVALDKNLALAVLAGLWWGAASHTLTDVAWSVVRKGSEIF
jgi:uncharacterized metal-binding protein